MIILLPAEKLSTAALPPAHNQLPPFSLDQCGAHRCDAHIAVIRDDLVVARSSLWWRQTPQLPGKVSGLIGHFAALDAGSAGELLGAACRELGNHSCRVVIGPMDGNTWRRYRLLTERGSEPSFFLEPDNPDQWPGFFLNSGFSPLATYFSALNNDLSVQDERIPRAKERLERGGTVIRQLDPKKFSEELGRIYEVSKVSFQANFLYTPIEQTEFLGQYESVRSFIRPELAMLAERAGEPVGFVFGIPDFAQAKRGLQVDTVVLKTVGILPGKAHAGLGNVLVAACQDEARALGFRRVIHALMHESNNSLNLSGHYAKPFRRYTLYSREL